MSETAQNIMLGALQKDLNEHKNNLNIANNQVLSHQEVITSLMQENLNLRTNFKLSQQYYNDATKVNGELNATIESLNKKITELTEKLDASKNELEALKNPSVASDCPVTPDSAVAA